MTDHPTTAVDPASLPSDRELVALARLGSDEAWSEVIARHGGAVRVLTSARSRRRVDERSSAALAHLRDELSAAANPFDDPATAVRSLRPRALIALTGGTYGPRPVPAADGVDPSVDGQKSGPDTDSDPEMAELDDVATAFARLPEPWQTVLWHGLAEREPAAETAPLLGRSVAEVVALQRTAAAGLFDAYLAVAMERPGEVDPACRPIVPLLGGRWRDTLPAGQRRVVDAHIETDAGCLACRHRLGLPVRFAEVVPAAIVPGVTGLLLDRSRVLFGAAGGAIGVAALASRRSARVRHSTRVGAAAAVVVALLGAGMLIKSPFEDFATEVDELARQATTTTDPSADDPPSTTIGLTGEQVGVVSRIDLLFPDAPQGIAYVPGGRSLDLGITMSSPAPVYAGGTGTIDAVLTNHSDDAAPVRFQIQATPGLTFETVRAEATRCDPSDDGGASCRLDLPAKSSSAMSLTFRVDAAVPERLEVVPSIRAQNLELPIEFVPGLVAASVLPGDVDIIGNTLGGCDEDPSCPSGGERDASSAVLELPVGSTVAGAWLTWSADDGDGSWLDEVGLIAPGQASAVSVGAGEQFDGDNGSGSLAEVTPLVRAGGAGDYTVVRPPSANGSLGDGAWSLIVLVENDLAPRRLLVVTRPPELLTPDLAHALDLPIAGSTPDSTKSLRALRVEVEASGVGDGAQQLRVAGQPLGGADPFGLPDGDRTGRGHAEYDLAIDSTDATVLLDASTTSGAVRLVAVGLAVDLGS